MTETNPVAFILTGEHIYQLIGVQTRYSSWTARVVPLLERYKLPYKLTTIKLSETKKYSNSGFVPVLVPLSPKLDIQIHDSLAISEFLAESHPEFPLWPKDRVLRALARSAAAEMHSGFQELRSNCPSHFLAKYTGNIPLTDKAKQEAERVLIIWDQARTKTAERLKKLGEEDEGYLFGKFGIADSFFWPVLWRFRSYGLPLATATPEALAWMKKMWNDPTLKLLGKDYLKQGEDPETVIPQYDNIFKGNPDIKYELFDENWEFTGA
ncbi:hypothetical protein OIDMADRAFT_169286 [Oidiodendron maius Zn]|uniref:GST N-terminal domain-containing protein n=1 Tax=Oidiodendron maius (strain Zn) TaxID=913774 RepID=A0A0C3H243_OIDMZ|nr:hypothetical protein OIDMADRAFT_169286 [Oidiodendron maius Zn]